MKKLLTLLTFTLISTAIFSDPTKDDYKKQANEAINQFKQQLLEDSALNTNKIHIAIDKMMRNEKFKECLLFQSKRKRERLKTLEPFVREALLRDDHMIALAVLGLMR